MAPQDAGRDLPAATAAGLISRVRSLRQEYKGSLQARDLDRYGFALCSPLPG